jgi:hypothetical protein
MKIFDVARMACLPAIVVEFATAHEARSRVNGG